MILELRNPCLESAAEQFKIVSNETARLSAYLGWAKSTPTLASQTEFVERVLDLEKSGKELHRMIYADSEFAGAISIHSLFDLGSAGTSAELGYWIRRDFEGRGLVNEAVRIALPLARSFGITLLRIKTHESNLRSQKTARLAGFQEVRTVGDHLHFELAL